MKRKVLRSVKEKSLEKCFEKAPLIVEVVKRGGSWCKLWDAALHLGTCHCKGLQVLTRLLVHHGHGETLSPV